MEQNAEKLWRQSAAELFYAVTSSIRSHVQQSGEPRLKSREWLLRVPRLYQVRVPRITNNPVYPTPKMI